MKPFRVAVLGNSHVGAFALGWKAMSENNPDINMTMFPCPGSTIERVRRKQRMLISPGRSPGGFWIAAGSPPVLDPGDYNALLILGFGGSVFSHIRLLREVCLFGDRKPRQRVRQISDAALTATFVDRILAVNAYGLASAVVGWTGMPAYFLPAPKPGEVALGSPNGIWLSRFVGDDEIARVFGCFDIACARAATSCGLTLLAQPPETVQANGYTRDVYKRDGVGVMRGSDNPKRNDVIHMNRDYGVAVLDAHLPRIRAELQAAGPRRIPGRACHLSAEVGEVAHPLVNDDALTPP